MIELVQEIVINIFDKEITNVQDFFVLLTSKDFRAI